MGKSSIPTLKKREKEKIRQQRKVDKAARRLEARERKASAPQRAEGEDPDIAGIIPGPQRLPPQFDVDPEIDQ